jgi:virginiamycin A acetyltransferase
MAGVTVGDGAVVGARSVVAKDVPPYSIVVGSPVRIVRKRFSDDVIDALMKVNYHQLKLVA